MHTMHDEFATNRTLQKRCAWPALEAGYDKFTEFYNIRRLSTTILTQPADVSIVREADMGRKRPFSIPASETYEFNLVE